VKQQAVAEGQQQSIGGLAVGLYLSLPYAAAQFQYCLVAHKRLTHAVFWGRGANPGSFKGVLR